MKIGVVTALVVGLLAVCFATTAGCQSSAPTALSKRTVDEQDVEATYRWPYAYSQGDSLYSKADSVDAAKTYLRIEGQWYMDDGLSDNLWPVAVGFATVRPRAGISHAEMLAGIGKVPELTGVTVDTTGRSVTRGYYRVTYPRDRDPVEILESLRATSLFTVGWLGTYGIRF